MHLRCSPCVTPQIALGKFLDKENPPRGMRSCVAGNCRRVSRTWALSALLHVDDGEVIYIKSSEVP